MIETTIIDYLNENLSVPAYMEKPEDPTASYVLVEKTAGGERNHIASAMVAVQSIAPTLLQAAQLNEEVKTWMRQLAVLPSVSRCSLNTDYNYSNPARKEHRYQAVFNLVYYE